MRRHGRQFLFALLLALAGCSAFLPKNKAPEKDRDLVVSFTDSNWQSIDPRQSDRAWSQRSRGDVMVLNSFCGEFQSLSLETLAIKTFQNYDGFKPLGKRTVTWYEREAFEMEAEATVDGVRVLMYLRNYRRDHCYYDFVLITPRSRDPQSFAAFQALLDSVRFP